MSLAMFCFSLVCVLLEVARNLQKHITQFFSRDGGMETSCSEVHFGKASCSMILKLRERQSCCSCVQPVDKCGHVGL